MSFYSRSRYVNLSEAEHVSGAENGAERAENWVERNGGWSGVAENDGAVAGRRAVSGLNRPLTARSNITFHST